MQIESNRQSPLEAAFRNLLLATLSLLLILAILEGLSRVILNPVDFLQPELVGDPVLGHAIEAGSAGHDAWGFRNPTVPGRAQIVAIGDSNTYGVSATATDSWPSALQRLSGKSVYNLSLGGYGPVQYFYLLTNKASRLRPQFVVVGFYYGNDLMETYKVIQNNTYWSHLKPPDFPGDDVAAVSVVARQSRVGPVRRWLSRNSILYRMAVFSVAGEVARVMEAKFRKTEDHVIYHKHGVLTGFSPRLSLKAMDLTDRRVEAGLRMSLELFSRMNAYSVEHDIHLVIALIPTKTSVYARYIENDLAVEHADAFNKLLANERRINSVVKAYFEEHSLSYIDLLPQLQANTSQGQLYPGNYDGHPNRNGYRVIAETVARYLRDFGRARSR
jgi:lysophospholipase L1-like esterase